MSWSVSGTVTDAVAVEDLVPDWDSYTDQTAVPEMKEQLDAAHRAVQEIIDSCALGDPNSEGFHVQVSLTGHANPDHGQRDGYGNDSIGLTVYRVFT